MIHLNPLSLCSLGLGLLICSAAGCDVEDGVAYAPGAGTDSVWDPQWQTMERAMLDEVNLRRAAGATCGVGDEAEAFAPTSALEMNEALQVAARLHSEDMATRDFFEHDNPDGQDPFARMEQAGYEGAYPWGENIQAGSPMAAEAVESLMNSPPHCRNIMDPGYHVMGTGYAFGLEASYGHYWTQTFGGGH